jgi:hypothetical protein
MPRTIKYTASLGPAGSMPRGYRLLRPSVSSEVVNPTISRNRGPDVWLTLAGWLWLIYFVSLAAGAIHWLIRSPQ